MMRMDWDGNESKDAGDRLYLLFAFAILMIPFLFGLNALIDDVGGWTETNEYEEPVPPNVEVGKWESGK